MTEIPYRKYHGTGNDFAVVEAGALEENRARFGAELCGALDADGVLFLELDTDPDPSRVDFHLIQPDGSTAEMCGNGARVAARWATEQTGEDIFVLDTPAGPREARVHEDRVTVEMGRPTFEPARVPIEAREPVVEESIEGFDVTAVNTGVPHAVVFLEDVDEIDIDTMAPPIRHHDRFPEGTNVTFAAPDEEVDFRQRTFERGVEGETQSCGTGAVAIAAVAGLLDVSEWGSTLAINPPGGILTVTAPEDGEATLSGPTAFEFEDTFTFEPTE